MDKKAQKKKDRAKRVRKQILLTREALRAPQQEENKLRRRMDRIARLKKDMGALNVWADDVLLKMNEKTLVQLEKNAKILKALENEYKEERDKKIKINEELEADGFLTLEEKLNHLHNKLVDEQKALHERDLNEFDQVIKDQLAVDRSDVVGHTKEVTGVDALNSALNEFVENES